MKKATVSKDPLAEKIAQRLPAPAKGKYEN